MNHRGQETPKGDLPEKSRQGKGATNKELPKGNCQDQGVAEVSNQDGAAKAEEPTGRHETAREDLPEKSRQGKGATNKELPKGNCQDHGVAEVTNQDGAAKAEEPIGCNKTVGEDPPERNGQNQRTATKELPKGSCQGQETPEARNTPIPSPGGRVLQMPLGNGRPLVLSQGTGENMPQPHGGPPLPARMCAPMEPLVQLRRMEGMGTYGGGSEGPQLQIFCKGAAATRLPDHKRHLVHLQTPQSQNKGNPRKGNLRYNGS